MALICKGARRLLQMMQLFNIQSCFRRMLGRGSELPTAPRSVGGREDNIEEVTRAPLRRLLQGIPLPGHNRGNRGLPALCPRSVSPPVSGWGLRCWHCSPPRHALELRRALARGAARLFTCLGVSLHCACPRWAAAYESCHHHPPLVPRARGAVSLLLGPKATVGAALCPATPGCHVPGSSPGTGGAALGMWGAFLGTRGAPPGIWGGFQGMPRALVQGWGCCAWGWALVAQPSSCSGHSAAAGNAVTCSVEAASQMWSNKVRHRVSGDVCT